MKKTFPYMQGILVFSLAASRFFLSCFQKFSYDISLSRFLRIYPV